MTVEELKAHLAAIINQHDAGLLMNHEVAELGLLYCNKWVAENPRPAPGTIDPNTGLSYK